MSLSRLFLFIVVAAFGCSSGTSVSTEPGSGTPDPTARSPATVHHDVIELRYDVTVDHLDLRLRLLTLKDARCPIGVTCVWAGQMLATVEVTHRSQGKVEVELLRKAGREPEVAKAFGYELRLLDVDPHPKKGITPDRSAYVMRVEIARP